MRAVRAATPAAEGRRRRFEALREAEAARRHRERLQAMLLAKLSGKYGSGSRGSTSNRAIEKGIDDFMAQRRNSETLAEQDLAKLEQRVVRDLEACGHDAAPRAPASAPTRAAPRPTTAPGKTARAAAARPAADAGRGGDRPSTAAFDSQAAPWLQGTSEWKILDAFQVVESAEASRQALADGKRKQRDFRRVLDAQLALKAQQAGGDRLQRDDDEFAATQARLLVDWRDEMGRTKRVVHDRYLEEKRVRDVQIEFTRSQRSQEARLRGDAERRDLEACQDAIEADKRKALAAKVEARRRLVEIQRETAKGQAAAADRRAAEGADDQRLMREYSLKLEREEEQRAGAFQQRMARLEQFSNKSATEGAGKALADFTKRQEALIMREAKIKEQADLDREVRDKAALRNGQRLMADDNRRLVAARAVQAASDQAAEDAYAKRYVRESHEFLRDEALKHASNRQKMVKHQAFLTAQIASTKQLNAVQDMDAREKQMNRALLARATADEATLAKLKKVFDAGETTKANARSTPRL
ncbi:hypothetical protein M885DRAFT_515195 [Pelagophyceae sp. CCMP2097]|nr:hypothetical protein M885DRAFT_515195 [Pelagophyceae sp. CCMP2097]